MKIVVVGHGFRLRGDLFCEVFVYMSGDNSLG